PAVREFFTSTLGIQQHTWRKLHMHFTKYMARYSVFLYLSPPLAGRLPSRSTRRSALVEKTTILLGGHHFVVFRSWVTPGTGRPHPVPLRQPYSGTVAARAPHPDLCFAWWPVEGQDSTVVYTSFPPSNLPLMGSPTKTPLTRCRGLRKKR
ncbi:unnamed protein product, partial [Ectocarpus sp. 4 AP-2014]